MVMGAGNDVVLANDDGTYRHFVSCIGFLSLLQGYAHEVFIGTGYRGGAGLLGHGVLFIVINVWWALSRDKINSIVTYKLALAMDIYGDIFSFMVCSVQRHQLC